MTQRVSAFGCRLAKCSAANRANVDLPPPSGPSTTAPLRAGSSSARSTCSNAAAWCGTFHRIGTAGFYGAIGPTGQRAGPSGVVYVSGMRGSSGDWAVCVYCASGPTHPELLELAAELGETIAGRGWTLVWGGGRVSAMGAVAAAARARGGRTIGVIPQMLMRAEVADTHADELIVTDTMHERKRVLEDRADAFLVLPGGVGTLDELFDAWTSGYLGMHDKPIVLLDPLGHYDGLWAWLRDLVDGGYISRSAMDRLVVVDKVGDAVEACAPA